MISNLTPNNHWTRTRERNALSLFSWDFHYNPLPRCVAHFIKSRPMFVYVPCWQWDLNLSICISFRNTENQLHGRRWTLLWDQIPYRSLSCSLELEYSVPLSELDDFAANEGFRWPSLLVGTWPLSDSFFIMFMTVGRNL